MSHKRSQTFMQQLFIYATATMPCRLFIVFMSEILV